jgi:hypothetical protein
MSDNEGNDLLVLAEEFGVALEESSKDANKNQKGLLNCFKTQVCKFGSS